MSGNTTLDSKPLRVVMDPEVRLADAQRRRYDAVLADLHEAQRRGQETANTLNALFPQMTAAATKLRASSAPADVKSRFEALNKEFDSLRVRFGVPTGAGGGGRGGGGGGGGRGNIDPSTMTPAQLDSLRQAANQEGGPGGGGGGGGGGGRGGADPRNALARLGTVKGGIMGIWEVPSAGVLKQGDDAKLALSRAITDANAFLTRLRPMVADLKRYDVTITIPPAR
jgi:hypothetical protein